MIYKVGDMVTCYVETQSNGRKKILVKTALEGSKVTKQTFRIAYVNNGLETYVIEIDDDMVGWNFNNFHIKYYKLPTKLFGKRFCDIKHYIILEKKT